jgi:drug/metabolite transporter (DMT)-like permease
MSARHSPVASVRPGFVAWRSTPLLVCAFCILWSSAFAAAKIALIDCPPLLLLVARFLLAGILMLAIAAISRVPWRMSRRDLLVLALLGVANNALYLGFNYVGMQTISSGLAALIVSANPILTASLAAVFLGERMSGRRILGLVLGIAGVSFIVRERMGSGIESPVGIAFSLAALLSIVGGTILFKRLAPDGGLWIGNAVQNIAGGLAVAPFALSLERIGDIVPTWRLFAALGYSVLLVSMIAYLIWFHLLTVSGATTASAYHFLMPPLGMLSGWLLLSEPIAWLDLGGIVPVAAGIYLVTRAGKPAAVRGPRAICKLSAPPPEGCGATRS